MQYLLLCSISLLLCFVAGGVIFWQRRMIRELRDKVSQTQNILEQRGLIANEVAHEIKNPLTAILCSVETLDLLIGDQIDIQHRKSLHYIKEFGEIVLRLISDFMDITRLDSGVLKAYPVSVSVPEVIQGVVGLLEASAWKKQMTIKTLFELDSPTAFVDPKHLKQIVFNLLHNAIRHSQSQGEIEVGVEGSVEAGVTIFVRDFGIGISAERVASICTPHTMIDTSGLQRMGLGLPLCYSLVTLAKGSLQIESTPGKGATIRVHLPLGSRPPVVSTLQERILPPINHSDDSSLSSAYGAH